MTDTLNKLKTMQAHLVKELTAGMKQAELQEGEDMLGIASVEIQDSDGDVILIDGIDFSKYHAPPKRHIKMLASHMGSLPSGEPPIIGRVERFFNTTVEANGQEVKALAFAFSFARDEEGELTPLANAYKRLMPKYLDSFSVGIMVDKWEERKESGGYNVTKSSLFEISAVAIPANSEANVIKAIKKVFEEEKIEVPEVEKAVEEAPIEDKIEQKEVEVDEIVEDSNTSTDDNEEIKDFISAHFSVLESRMDSIEATLAVMSQAKEEQTDEPKSTSAAEIDQLKTIKLALEKLKGLKTGN